MSNATCLRCHRPLSDPASREHGYGPICWAKVQADAESAHPERMRLLHPVVPNASAVILRRDPDGWSVATNVTWLVVHHSPDGFEWGYGGSGPADLALNILEAFVPGDDVRCYRGRCSQFAWDHHQAFKREFIAAVPHEGGEIPIEAITNWITIIRAGQVVQQAMRWLS